MTMKIVFDDEKDHLTFFIQDMEVATCSVEAFSAEYFKSNTQVSSDYLPNAIRYYDANSRIFIFEDKPQYRTYNYTFKYLSDFNNIDNASNETYFLPMPWMRYLVVLSSTYELEKIYGFMAHQPFDHNEYMTDCPILMHNWYEENSLCRPMYTNNPFEFNHKSLLNICDQVQKEIWDSGFNNDLNKIICSYFDLLKDSGSDHAWETSLFRYANKKDTIRAFKHNFSEFFRSYYASWANCTMDEVMESIEEYAKLYQPFLAFEERQPRSLMLSLIKNLTQDTNSSNDYNVMTSRVFVAAQNASMA